jgi:DNA-binding response OmpR family regulator
MTCPDCAKLRARIAILEGDLNDLTLMLTDPTADEHRAMKEAFGLQGNEASILLALYRAHGRCVSIENLLQARIKDYAKHGGTDAVLKVYIVRIRKKVGKEAVANNWGVGYSITPEGITTVKAALTAAGLSAQ